MLISPRPGTNRQNLLDTLTSVHTKATNAHSACKETAYEHLLNYLEWAEESVRMLRNQVSTADLTALVLTKRHDVLLNGVGHLAATAQQRLVNLLVNQELTERIETLDAAITLLKETINRWSGQEWFVVADSSFYIQNPVKLADVDLHAILGLQPSERIRLLFPITVVDELDSLKEAGKERPRWRAAHTLGLLDEVLNGAMTGTLRHSDSSAGMFHYRGSVNVEMVLDPPGHVRLPIPDDEIIDRAVAVQALGGSQVRLLTCDTGQHTRGCAAGLQVTKVPTKDPGPEPDWAAKDKPGNGGRARRRAKQAEAESAERPPEEAA